MRKISILFSVIILGFSSCSQDDSIDQVEIETTGIQPENTNIKGFYLLNEGNMGTNRASIDFLDYEKGQYQRNIYATANPTIVKELGDVGNDIKIYGNRLYAVINVSNYIEVMDAKTAKHIGSIPVNNVRYITFDKGKAYASSYAGPVEISENAPIGKVVEIDTASLAITREVTVGYQPDELVVVGNKLFVANSGGYRVPNYDKTVSVVDLASFKEEKKIDVAINLHHIKKDQENDLYVSSRGDYYNIPSNLFVLDSKTHQIKKNFNIPVTNFTIVDDFLYYYANEFNYNTYKWTRSYGVINTKTEEIVNQYLIKDPIIDKIKTPYGIAVNPTTKDIYLTDAGDYVSTGYVYAFDKNGKFKWKVAAGNIPAHFVFLNK
ncbi:YncE family protein [Weeksella virosa]|uniref:YncE family protein n=1 Tax=Weeksella virosa TaxID=1014 RepID=UPI002556FD2E|nr:DUF5074 domain-containing protein [Weeksella virosa]MDK7675208.1 YncE family protein [Weeksella virosa]